MIALHISWGARPQTHPEALHLIILDIGYCLSWVTGWSKPVIRNFSVTNKLLNLYEYIEQPGFAKKPAGSKNSWRGGSHVKWSGYLMLVSKRRPNKVWLAPRGRISHMKGWGCSSEILNKMPKGDQSWHEPGLFDPQETTFKTSLTYIFKFPYGLHIMAFSPEHPQLDQNLIFTP